MDLGPVVAADTGGPTTAPGRDLGAPDRRLRSPSRRRPRKPTPSGG